MSRRVEYPTQIVVRCTEEERAAWKALAERLDTAKGLALRQTGVLWRYRDQHITVSSLVRQLLERELQAHPAAPPPAAASARSRRRRRNAPAAASTS